MIDRLAVPLVLAALAHALPAEPQADALRPEELLVLGPLPLAAPAFADDAGEVEPVPELDPAATWPSAGDALAWAPGATARWTVAVSPGGALPPGPVRSGAGPGSVVQWVALYAEADRRGTARVELAGPGALRLWLDGHELGASGAPQDGRSELEASATLTRGRHRLLARVERRSDVEPGPVELALHPADGQHVAADLDPRHAPADYDELRAIVSTSGLRLSPDGALLALVRTFRDAAGDGSASRLDVLRLDDGSFAAAALWDPGARPVEWCPDGSELLLRRGGDLAVWRRADRSLEVLLEDEPGLGAVAWAPDGSFLVFASERGAEPRSAGTSGDARRRVHLREKLDDWPTAPHLHVWMREGGARRRLSAPGDWSQDAFAVLPDGRSLLTLRNVPIDRRPWFATEVARLDLASGELAALATLTMGFENRPGLAGFAVSPDGSWLAFVGPPSELGDGVAVEPNAFDPDLWLLRIDGEGEPGPWKVTEDLAAAVEGDLRWAPDSRSIYFRGLDGSRGRLYRALLEGERGRVVFAVVPVGGDGLHEVSVAAVAPRFACVVSSPDRLPVVRAGASVSGAGASDGPRGTHALHALGYTEPDVVLDDHAALHERWALAAPADASFRSPDDGEPREAWLYRPVERAGDGPLPLVVYYYGGATPVTRRFDELHQFVVANGYALYVVNPRGAAGYGERFADAHVADWGPRAGADVLAGVADVLARHPDLDPDRVGCYGGSYGGFMTLWLIAHSDRFAAAASLYGISSLSSYWGSGMWGWTYGDQALARKYPWQDAEWFAERSPLFRADRVATPLLLMHGDEDANVPPAESEQMFTALDWLGRDVELVRFGGEDHGLRGRWANRVAHRTMLVEWFDRWLRDQPEGWEARW